MTAHRTLRLLTIGAVGLLLLTGCATSPDPVKTRDSITEVTEDPAEPDAAQRYDAELSPEPIVDPVDCTDLLIVTVRGTGEPTDGQLLSPVARLIAQSRTEIGPSDGVETGRDTDHDTEPGGEDEPLADQDPTAAEAESTPAVQILDLDYPASTDVKEGGTLGVRMLIDTLNVQASDCPGQSFVLLGYSQGALVLGDALSSPDARMIGATVGEVVQDAADRIRAVVLYGDPRFVGDEPYNAGSYDPLVSGLLPRPADSLDDFAERLRDYCAAGDFICQSSLDLDEEGHVSYFDNGMQQLGANFAISRLAPHLS